MKKCNLSWYLGSNHMIFGEHDGHRKDIEPMLGLAKTCQS